MPIPGFPFSFSALEVKAQLSAQAESMSAQAFQPRCTPGFWWFLEMSVRSFISQGRIFLSIFILQYFNILLQYLYEYIT